VVGVGENSVDLLVRLPARPEFGPGEKMPIESQTLAMGGQVVTALCTCASLGLRTAYVGVFGDDEHGRFARRELEQRSVDTSASFVRQAPTRQAVILVDAQGERSVLWSRDPALALRPGDVPEERLQQSRVVHLDGVDADAAIRSATVARQAGAIVTCDIDVADTAAATLFEGATHPIVAERVPPALTGQADVERALRQLRRRHSGPICVTLGARGALLLDGDDLHFAPPPDVNVVDTTGAGDVFRGAYITALLEGLRPEAVLRFATVAAAISCTRVGAVGGVPTRAEIESMLAAS
jgi:sugar/nucleoside kinase (ribokinase family)